MWVTKTLTLKCPNEGAWFTRLRVDEDGEVDLNGYTDVDHAVLAQRALKTAARLAAALEDSGAYEPVGVEADGILDQLRSELAELGPVDLVDEETLPPVASFPAGVCGAPDAGLPPDDRCNRPAGHDGWHQITDDSGAIQAEWRVS